MRRWTHEVSAAWLEARRSVLTATEIAGLMPEYRKYLKRQDPDTLMPGFAALWAAKHSDTELDVSSPSPAAARGHILEPWAVKSWNEQASPIYYHWDDCVICNGIFGFSPDAMDIMQLYPDAKLMVSSDGKFLKNVDDRYCSTPHSILEIKSYEVPRHMKSVIMNRMDHDELMQLAMAFVVLPELEEAKILWFCPGAPISMHSESYTRDDLHDQISLITEVADVYEKQAELCSRLASSLVAKCTEQEIWDAFVAEQASDSDNVFMLRG